MASLTTTETRCHVMENGPTAAAGAMPQEGTSLTDCPVESSSPCDEGTQGARCPVFSSRSAFIVTVIPKDCSKQAQHRVAARAFNCQLKDLRS